MFEYMQSLGDAVKKARLELGLTQIEVAARIDIDSRTILKIENHSGNPKMEILYPLIRELKIDPNKVFYPELECPSNALAQFQRFLVQCSDDDLRTLLPICKTVLTVLHSKNSFSIADDK